MGPRRIRRGEPEQRAVLAASLGASMGPRRIRRGERATSCSGRSISDELQWGHGEFAVENGRFPAVHFASPLSFNGATANSPWRTINTSACIEISEMLQWGHGEFAVENRIASLLGVGAA